MRVDRRRLLTWTIGSAWAGWPLAGPLRAAPLVDALDRPALAMTLASRPAMLRVVRAGERLVAVGERGLVLLSDDDGRTWRQASVPVSVTLTGAQFLDAQRGWAIGHGAVVLHSEDGGEHWSRQHDGRSLPDGPVNPLLDLHFDDASHGWAVGAFGLALHTDDGGRRWQARTSALPNPKGLHLYALARQGTRLFIAGEQGLFLSMTASGDDAKAVATPYRGSFFAMSPLANGRLLLGGLRGTLLLRQSDGEFAAVESGTAQAIVSTTLLGPDRLGLVDESGRVLIGAPPVAAGAGGFVMQPPEAERRWVSITAARDGGLVGACNVGVGRLARSDVRNP